MWTDNKLKIEKEYYSLIVINNIIISRGTFAYSLYKNNKILDDTPIINKIFINLIFFLLKLPTVILYFYLFNNLIKLLNKDKKYIYKKYNCKRSVT